MADLPFTIPVGPEAIRIFAGYRAEGLSREAFYGHLGETFMPGTPYMLAPLALSAYVPAVLDLDDGLPEEVALIVYTSLDLYNHFRGTSLRRRVYTHSHAGVFDMDRSRGQFPGPCDAPALLEGTGRRAWVLTDRAVDWQTGTTHVVVLTPGDGGSAPFDTLHAATCAARDRLAAAGVDQVVCLSAPDYAALWAHSPGADAADPASLGLVPEGLTVARSLTAAPVPMPTLTEGVEVTGPSAFTFRFVRELRFAL